MLDSNVIICARGEAEAAADVLKCVRARVCEV